MRRLRITPAWLLPENRRGYIALGFGTLAALLSTVVIPRAGEGVGASTVTRALLVLVVYLLAYCALTVVALVRTPWSELETWARSTKEGSLRARFVELSEPGAGLALYVSGLALTGTVVLARDFTTADEGELLTAALAIALIALAWVTALLTFTVDYLTKDARRGWSELAFPGDGPRGVADYVYFAAAVSTTFGTTDVNVVSRRLRRDVAMHGIVAFVFNTVVIVVALSLVTG